MNDDELRRRLDPLSATLPVGQARGVAAPAPAPAAMRAAPPAKPPRRGIEFLLPDAVVTEIKTRAARRGVTATILLLELLREAGYPVVEADFTDLRKQPRR
ncbi:hypothetical protein ACFQS7_27510 [Dankookia sp. GCM10030260]|uniref:hypothetical protein n=1 Tax=Dankookia sp. GCM10030260 TaxID=3273390 RepID=UPI00361C8553